ncbi:MAG: putative RDD family membrane protein YckC [Candidatus Endobugula sp.]|jgi:uncharacterized RDD family membrane protein YckC
MSHSLPYPALWRRFAAIIYDSLFIMALSMAYGAVSLGLGLALFGNQFAVTSTIAFQLGWPIVIIAFFCYFWVKAGQTLGMRAWRLMLVKEEGMELPSLSQSIMRCILAPLGLSMCCIALLRQDKQCLHDLLSHTQLVLTAKIK